MYVGNPATVEFAIQLNGEPNGYSLAPVKKQPFQTLADDVAHALVRAVSRLSRHLLAHGKRGVGMSADAARTSACATSKWNGYYLTDA
jgi:hypothetical protein